MPGRCWGFALYKEAISSDPSVAGQDLLYLPTNYLWTHSGRRMLDYWLIFSGILLTNWNGGIFLYNLNCQILDDNSLLPWPRNSLSQRSEICKVDIQFISRPKPLFLQSKLWETHFWNYFLLGFNGTPIVLSILSFWQKPENKFTNHHCIPHMMKYVWGENLIKRLSQNFGEKWRVDREWRKGQRKNLLPTDYKRIEKKDRKKNKIWILW